MIQAPNGRIEMQNQHGLFSVRPEQLDAAMRKYLPASVDDLRAAILEVCGWDASDVHSVSELLLALADAEFANVHRVTVRYQYAPQTAQRLSRLGWIVREHPVNADWSWIITDAPESEVMRLAPMGAFESPAGCPHAESRVTPDGHGAYCVTCGETLA